MIRLAHISDPHLGPLPDTGGHRLGLKQMIGRMNWQQNRARTFSDGILSAVLADLHTARPDHIAVTGDLINLGLSAEIGNAERWLNGLGEPDEVTVVPGNHDAYISTSLADATTTWRAYMAGDRAATDSGRAAFPFVRKRGDVALIAASTAIATPPLMATGRVGADQIRVLGGMLEAAGAENLCRVLLIHHPPDAATGHWHKRLLDADAVRDVVSRHGAELVLHGHNHRNRITSIDGPSGPVPVVGVAAMAMRPHNGKPAGSWNMITVNRRGRGFEIKLAVKSWVGAEELATTNEAQWIV